MSRQRASAQPRSTSSGSRIEKARIAKIFSTLERTYNSPRLGNKSDPLDELVFILLSQMTTAPSYSRVYQRLRRECRPWSRLAVLPLAQIRGLIADAGLSRQRAANLKGIACQLRTDFGHVTLNALFKFSDEEAEKYLLSLPGVGIKTAKCVLMYSLGRAVLPVDTHVARVSRRLGLLRDHQRSPVAVHAALEAAIPPGKRYEYHVNALSHGRAVCRAVRPRCPTCTLGESCPTAKPGSH